MINVSFLFKIYEKKNLGHSLRIVNKNIAMGHSLKKGKIFKKNGHFLGPPLNLPVAALFLPKKNIWTKFARAPL